MSEPLEGKHFSIMDPQNVNTVIYEISKTEKNIKNAPRLTIERLEYTEEIVRRKKEKDILCR